ncbi:PilZ domain-containing protein [Sphingomonas sp.]|uniref:PilZ domain-containing protein n=1 Tax=Sphingomonas sp. TaxID=28214 RepID=UPI0025D8DBDE|nr:PilZ domain-containing protein [Sphingomonas sp.]
MPHHVERVPRVSLMLMAQVFRHQGGEPTLHRVSNLSARGVRIVQAGKLAPGDQVTILVGCAEPVTATVAWLKDDVAGLEFEGPICLENARQRRTDFSVPDIRAGWMTEIKHAHRR